MFTFPLSEVRRLIEVGKRDAAANGGFRNPYGFSPEKARPGIWLVGDQGVYIMANGMLAEGAKPDVVYAPECDPTGESFDWYDYKRTHFGGDDGIEFIAAEELLDLCDRYPSGKLLIRLTEDNIDISALV